jgi:hypothetical protein
VQRLPGVAKPAAPYVFDDELQDILERGVVHPAAAAERVLVLVRVVDEVARSILCLRSHERPGRLLNPFSPAPGGREPSGC